MQETRRAVFAPGQAKEDWQIVARLAQVVGKPLAYESHSALRARIGSEFAHLAELDGRKLATWKAQTAAAGAIKGEKFDYPVQNFYMTDPISRTSKTMAQCAEAVQRTREEKKAAA